MRMRRRKFIRSSVGWLAALSVGRHSVFQNSISRKGKTPLRIQTVNGSLDAQKMGLTLIHEHILVDFIGADKTGADRWNHNAVVAKVLPYLLEIKALGCQTLIECTPSYLGKDPVLLKRLADESGLQIITNTGYYGAVQNKFLPPHAFTETADQLAARWIREYEKGIGGTKIRPGFMKISVEPGQLSEMHQKLIRAAARTHLKTGLTIASHTGFATPAFGQIEILKREGVHPQAFVWVHAQNERNKEKYIQAARQGTWISLDGLSDENTDEYLRMLQFMRDRQMWHRTLVSHDAGWYRPEEPGGGEFRPFTTLFTKLIPLLKANGFTQEEIDKLLIANPMEAFAIRVRPLGG